MKETADRLVMWHEHSVTRADRERLNGHKGVTVWLTGLSGSGKSTLANATARVLHNLGVRTFVLDGDNIRHGLNKDLGFSPEDRKENIRRIGEVSKLMTEAGVVNFTAFISPYREDRTIARDLQPSDFVEVHVDCSLQVCEQRDPKGMYKKARAGQIKEFTGISAPYEPPEKPELYVDTSTSSIAACVESVLSALADRGIVDRARVSKGAVEAAAAQRVE